MDYAKLKAELVEIVEVSSQVPEEFRSQCFAMLFDRLLKESSGGTSKNNIKEDAENESENGSSNQGEAPLRTSGSFKAFMKRTKLEQKTLESVVMLEGNEVHFLVEPSHNKLAKGTLEWALLLALKNGLVAGTLSTDPETLRSVVQEKGFYDRPNFATGLKSEKYKEYFKGPLEYQGEARVLTPSGEQALAKLMQDLVTGSNK
ncbi:MAG TPA: hypothetical protein VM639_00650 [Dongiaceae bacterium]|nr:hypothetical protein [Dongiaceae bacterium]